MMEFFKSWTFSVCSTVLLAAILSLLSPHGGMGRFYKVIISAFVLVSFLLPLGEIKQHNFKSSLNFESEYYDTQVNSAKIQVETLVKQQLDSAGFVGCTVDCAATQIGDEIEINNVVVTAPNGSDEDEIKSLILNILGIAVEVKITN